jgi:hypothetical protein
LKNKINDNNNNNNERFFVLMKSTGYGDGEEDVNGGDGDDGTILDKTFTHVQTSFLTLFRMLLGDFDMAWFIRDGEKLLTVYAIVLFILCKSSVTEKNRFHHLCSLRFFFF